MPEQAIIPIRIRTARIVHTCGQCLSPILPGEQYEDRRLPPGRDPTAGAHWWPVEYHYAITSGYSGYGCDVAEAYREQAARLRASALARPALTPIGTDLGLLCDATHVVVHCQRASQALIQRQARVGFIKAGRLLILLEEYGVTGPRQPGRDTRSVLVPPWELVSALATLREMSRREEPALAR